MLNLRKEAVEAIMKVITVDITKVNMEANMEVNMKIENPTVEDIGVEIVAVEIMKIEEAMTTVVMKIEGTIAVEGEEDAEGVIIIADLGTK